MMLRMAIAEKDSSGCSALDRFAGLFSVNQPATATSLIERLSFLEEHCKYSDQYLPLLEAIACALRAQEPSYADGAEIRGLEQLVCYSSQNDDEIKAYLKGCLDILMRITKHSFLLLQSGCKILLLAVEKWSIWRKDSLIWPYVLEVCEYLDYDWDEMYDALRWMVAGENQLLSGKILDEGLKLIDKLTKTDFFSRYVRVEQRSYCDLTWEQILEKERVGYIALAEEMAKDSLYTVEMLTKIYSERGFMDFQFGCTLAQCLSESEQHVFIQNSIKALNDLEGSEPRVFVAFLQTVPEWVFSSSLGEMKKLRDKSPLFMSVARKGYALDSSYVEELFQMVRAGDVGVEALVCFYNNYCTKKDAVNVVRIELLKRISKLPNSLYAVLELSESRLHEEDVDDDLILFLEDLLLANILQVLNGKNKRILWFIVAELLRRGCSSQFASEISKALVVDSSSWGYISHGEHKCISLLFEDYFDEVWPIFSMALLRREGETLVFKCNPYFSPFRIMEVHEALFCNPTREAIVLQWCDEYSHEGPARLMAVLPLYQGGSNRFSDFVMKLIDRYGDQEEVLSSLSSNMGSFSSMGSRVPYYENRLTCLSPLMEHPIEAVRVWASNKQRELKLTIPKEVAHDAERRAYSG